MAKKAKDIRLSAMVVAHNEERHLPDCLASLRFADELVVVLDRCTDNSEKIARQYADKIIVGAWPHEGERRKVAAEACTGKWLVVFDADERVPPELAKEMRSAVEQHDDGCFMIYFVNYIGDCKITHAGLPDILGNFGPRLYTRGSLRSDKKNIRLHGSAKPVGTVRFLKNSFIHYVDDDIADLIARFNRYTDLRALDLYDNPAWRRSYFRCFTSIFSRFLRGFVFRKAYKGGKMGFLITLLGALYPLVSHMKADLDVRLKEKP